MIDHYVASFGLLNGRFGGFPDLGGNPFAMIMPHLYLWIPGLYWGPFGVALFFLISGFVIPISLQRMAGTPYWVPRFALARLVRLWPTYTTGFFITIVVLHYSYSWNNLAFWPAANGIARHLSFFRDWLGYTNLDGIVWTLEVEVKFYVVMALFAGSIAAGKLGPFFFMWILAAAALYFKNGETITVTDTWLFPIPYITFMMIGVAFNFFFKRKISVGVFVLIGMISLVLFCACVSPDLRLNYSYAVIVFGCCYLLRNRIKFSNPVTDFFAKISFSLYVCHAYFGFVGIRVMIAFGANPYLALLIQIPVTIALATLVNRIVEMPSHKWSHAISRWSPAVTATA